MKERVDAIRRVLGLSQEDRVALVEAVESGGLQFRQNLQTVSRFLLDDAPEVSERAGRYLARDQHLFAVDCVLTELERELDYSLDKATAAGIGFLKGPAFRHNSLDEEKLAREITGRSEAEGKKPHDIARTSEDLLKERDSCEPDTVAKNIKPGEEPKREVEPGLRPPPPKIEIPPLTEAEFETGVYREVCNAMAEASTNTPENLTRILSQVEGRKFPTTESNRHFAKWLNRVFSGSRFGIECAGCAADGMPGIVARVLYRTQGRSSRYAFRHDSGTHSQFDEGAPVEGEDRSVIQTLNVIPRILPLPRPRKL